MQADLSYTPKIFLAVPCASKEPCKRKLRPCPMLGWQSSLHTLPGLMRPMAQWGKMMMTLLGHRNKTHHFLQNIDINFSQTHINTTRIIFPRYSLQCDLYSCNVLLQRLSLHALFFWWTHPRGVVATFQHLLQLKEFPLQVLVFLHQIDCNPSSQLSSVGASAMATDRWGLNLHPL